MVLQKALASADGWSMLGRIGLVITLVLGIAQGIVYVLLIAHAIISRVRRKAISREEEERALMRSMSWPGNGSQFDDP